MTTAKTTAWRGMLMLSPMAVFLLFYVAVSVVIGDFYRMPISVALLAASVWGIIIFKGHALSERIEVFSRAAGHGNILYMLWIFVLAGAFANLARELGAVQATVDLALRFFPPGLVVPILFFGACFISLSIGTSVGTVVALTPLATEMAAASGANVAFYVAVVLGGSFFGDNLSFISDTTIAATRTQGCAMSDKFKANLRIVLPAALATLLLYVFSDRGTPQAVAAGASQPWLIFPYLLVIVLAAAGVNVCIVLSLGIAAAFVMGLLGGTDAVTMAVYMGGGIDSMGNLIIITLLAAGMLGIIKANGGIDYLLSVFTARISGTRGAQAVLAVLVGLVNLCTANNTVAIITVGDLSRRIAAGYHISPSKSASILDSASCVVQCLIPYGAQTLLATSLAAIAPSAPFPYLYYPWALALTLAVSIVVKKRRG